MKANLLRRIRRVNTRGFELKKTSDSLCLRGKKGGEENGGAERSQM